MTDCKEQKLDLGDPYPYVDTNTITQHLQLIDHEAESLQAALHHLVAHPLTYTQTSLKATPLDPLKLRLCSHLASLRALTRQAPYPPPPPLPTLPEAPLQLTLRLAGPHTRQVSRRFLQVYGPLPPTLRPLAAPTLTTPAALLATLAALRCLPAATCLDLAAVAPLLRPETLQLLLATTSALSTLHFPTADLPPSCLVGLRQHAATLQELTISTDIDDAAGALLASLTALRTLAFTDCLLGASLLPLASLTGLTRLAFGKFCEGTCGEEVLLLARSLGGLRDLRLPCRHIEWTANDPPLLRQLTKLTALQLGTFGGALSTAIAADMAGAAAALEGLQELELVDPLWWAGARTSPAFFHALGALPLRSLQVHQDYGEQDADGLDAVARSAALQLVAPGWRLTRLAFTAHEELHCYGGPVLRAADLDTALWPLRDCLQELVLVEAMVPADLVARLHVLRKLQRLDIVRCWHFSDGPEPTPYPDGRTLPVPFAGLGQLTGLTSLRASDDGCCFSAACWELPQLRGLRELSVAGWPQRASDLWCLVPLRQLTALTVCARYLYRDWPHEACVVLQHCTALRTVTGAGRRLQQALCAEEVRRLAVQPVHRFVEERAEQEEGVYE